VAALVAAFAVLLLRHFAAHPPRPWLWADFGEDLIRNGLIGGLVAFATVVLDRRRALDDEDRKIRQQRRQVLRLVRLLDLVLEGWIPVKPPEQKLETRQPAEQVIENRIQAFKDFRDNLSSIAARLEEVHAGGDEATVQGLMLGAIIERYLFEGARRRRFFILQTVSDGLREIELHTVADDLAAKIGAVRDNIAISMSQRSKTDTTVIERILVERHVRPTGLSPLDDNMRERLLKAELEDAAVENEPLYLLLAYIGANIARPPSLDVMQDNLRLINRCIGALRAEVGSMAETMNLFADLVEEASTDDSHIGQEEVEVPAARGP
jgi:hypothetical protein